MMAWLQWDTEMETIAQVHSLTPFGIDKGKKSEITSAFSTTTGDSQSKQGLGKSQIDQKCHPDAYGDGKTLQNL